MKDPNKKGEVSLTIFLILWSIILAICIGGATWGTIEISKMKQDYAILADRPSSIEKTVETRLQPIYTTILGQRGATGATGNDGKDSISTHSETTTIIKTETAIPGPQGKTGKSGVNGRELELGYNAETNTWYQRYVGDDTWNPVTVLEANP